MGPRDGLDERKISSPPGLDLGSSTPKLVAIATELPGPTEYLVFQLPVYKTETCILNVYKPRPCIKGIYTITVLTNEH